MAAGDHLTPEALIVGALLCVVTHGLFIGTGFEEYLYKLFGSSHVHGGALAMGPTGAEGFVPTGHEGHLHGTYNAVSGADSGMALSGSEAQVVEPRSSARAMFGAPVPSFN